MGSCLSWDSSNTANDSFSSLGNLTDHWGMNESFYDDMLDYDDLDLGASAPCRSCALLDASSLPFFIVASVLGILASAAVLLELFRPLSGWRVLAGRPLLAQLAVGCTLFCVVLPLMAPGLGFAFSTSLCQVAHLGWYSAAFAQALLIALLACLGPKLGAVQTPRLTLGLPLGLWLVAILLGLPIALSSKTPQGHCALNLATGPLYAFHVVTCFTIFLLLPLGLLGVKVVKKVLGRGPCPQVDVLWVWFLFWGPHGVVLGMETLVKFRVVLLSVCSIQQALDLLLHLAQALAILHCVATPMLLAFYCHRATRPAPLPIPEGPTSYLEPPAGKS